MHSPSPHQRLRSRLGFTLAELIVGIVLLTVGLGALASTAAYLLYEIAASRRAERGAILGHSRLEHLRLGTCTSASGVALHDGVTERWAVVATGRHATTSVAISWRERDRDVVQRYQGGFTC